MALSVKVFVLSMFIMLPLSSSASSPSPSSPLTCRSEIKPFLYDLQLQCPTTIIYSSPIEMDGDSLESVLNPSHMNAYIAILFYASWCPFSTNVQPKFAALSSMYPQIKHLTVEKSSVLPIKLQSGQKMVSRKQNISLQNFVNNSYKFVFSRHGIHSVPSILIVNKTSTVRHQGPKDLHSLIHFYRKATGLEPVVDLTEDQTTVLENKSRNLDSHEPYLIFSLFFLFSRAFLYLYPNIISNMITLWLARLPHLNLSIFGESRQLLGRFLHLVDIKRAFTKLKLSKSRNFFNGARNARVWASSLASFALGKTSFSRASNGGKL